VRGLNCEVGLGKRWVSLGNIFSKVLIHNNILGGGGDSGVSIKSGGVHLSLCHLGCRHGRKGKTSINFTGQELNPK